MLHFGFNGPMHVCVCVCVECHFDLTIMDFDCRSKVRRFLLYTQNAPSYHHSTVIIDPANYPASHWPSTEPDVCFMCFMMLKRCHCVADDMILWEKEVIGRAKNHYCVCTFRMHYTVRFNATFVAATRLH